MKKSTLLLTVIFVAASVAVIGYAYVVFGDRYFKAGDGKQEAGNGNQNSIIDSLGDYLGGGDKQNTDNQNMNGNQNGNENINVNSNASSTESGGVTSKDCDNDCVRLKDNQERYKYCQEVCGDTVVSKKNSEAECDELSGLEKDYCFRDLAVSKKDSDICAKIGDQKLQSVCRNRVTEELLE
ncbi:MAG: hypothetical protein FJZ04_01935 [Candidatus Moranbacteria bacterium]|nr:hypothetical protein [Candidatus Moranbacteria bacterium]